MSDTFRDAIAASIGTAFDNFHAETPDYVDDHLAAGILASDEMQAIRRTLLSLDDEWRVEGNWDRGEYLQHYCKLPESVIAWVLDDPSPDSPADKPCETCGGTGERWYEWGGKAGTSDPCPSCRGGEHHMSAEPKNTQPGTILWSPCCDIIRITDRPGTVHSGLCRSKHNGTLGPTIRLVPHPHDMYDAIEYLRFQEHTTRGGEHQ